LVSDSLSDEGQAEGQKPPQLTYSDRFHKVFPYYLAIGMSEEQFWDGDAELCKYYREADDIRTERNNQDLWLQGMYIYEAICSASPIFNPLAKRGTKPHPYSKEPYPVSRRQRREAREREQKRKFNKGKRYMEMFMASQKAKKGD